MPLLDRGLEVQGHSLFKVIHCGIFTFILLLAEKQNSYLNTYYTMQQHLEIHNSKSLVPRYLRI